jgi:hypothetical protein
MTRCRSTGTNVIRGVGASPRCLRYHRVIGGLNMPPQPFTLPPGGRMAVRYASVNGVFDNYAGFLDFKLTSGARFAL